ncbi:MAG: hypothetical protein N2510_03290 [Ignavibacteria bacterium]|nr:hypothetical protein [Ignavibacteria bacterium]
MKLGIGFWIGITGAILGLGIAIAVSVLTEQWLAVAIIIIATVFVAAIIWYVILKPVHIRTRLEKNGVPAEARIIKVSDTGVTVNKHPQVKLLLEINSQYSGKYLVETKQVISRLQVSLFQPGSVIPVLIDPNDKNLVTINYSAGASSSGSYSSDRVNTGPWAGMSQKEVQEKLLENQKKWEEISAKGIYTRAIVIKYTWLGVYVNGQNPAVELELEVLPQDRSSFRSKAWAVIKESSVPLYQPGEEIFVKYLPENTSVVAVAHS